MKAAARRFGALSDETRLRLVFALRHGELCVCQLVALLELAPSTVSKHLSILRDAGLVDSRKQGRWVHYRLLDASEFPLFGAGAPPLFRALLRSEPIKADDRRLRDICREDMEDLCRRLARKGAPRGS